MSVQTGMSAADDSDGGASDNGGDEGGVAPAASSSKKSKKDIAKCSWCKKTSSDIDNLQRCNYHSDCTHFACHTCTLVIKPDADASISQCYHCSSKEERLIPWAKGRKKYKKIAAVNNGSSPAKKRSNDVSSPAKTSIGNSPAKSTTLANTLIEGGADVGMVLSFDSTKFTDYELEQAQEILKGLAVLVEWYEDTVFTETVYCDAVLHHYGDHLRKFFNFSDDMKDAYPELCTQFAERSELYLNQSTIDFESLGMFFSAVKSLSRCEKRVDL